MSALDQSTDADFGEKKSMAWIIPAILLAIDVVAFLLCAYGSPWSYSYRDALIISVLSAIPLLALGYLTLRIYRCHGQLRQELSAEQERAGLARAPRQTEELRDRMRHARQHLDHQARGAAFNEFTDAESLMPLTASGRFGLVAATESYMTQRFVAGEDLRLDALRSFLNEHALDRAEPLQRDHELAFGIGLAGTVLGLGVQLFLAGLQSESNAQISVFSQTFLTGVVLKASSTFVGILVAAYARALRWKLLEDYDRLVAQLEEFVSFRIAPLFTAVRAERGDLGETLRGVIEELKNTVGQIEINLRTALYEAVGRASEALGEKLKQTFASELAESIQEQITKPFRTEVDRLKEAIARTGDAISENARGLREGAREFKEEFSNTVRASFTISKELQDASHVLERVAQKFEEIVEQAERVSTTLRASEGEVARAIQESRGQDNNLYYDNPAISDLTEIARLLREATQNMDRQLASVAQLSDRLDGPRPGRRQGGER